MREQPPSRQAALAPDTAALDDRSTLAWTEEMVVRPLKGSRYVVDGERGGSHVVNLERGYCSCPDHERRGERCKHLRRVAIEINLGRVPPPGQRIVECANCGDDLTVDVAESEPHLCESCALEPGERLVDEETDATVRVVSVTDRRAGEVAVPQRDCTVADYPSNGEYPPDDVVVNVLYPGAEDAEQRRIYSLPLSRLARGTGDEHEQSTLSDHATAT